MADARQRMTYAESPTHETNFVYGYMYVTWMCMLMAYADPPEARGAPGFPWGCAQNHKKRLVFNALGAPRVPPGCSET